MFLKVDRGLNDVTLKEYVGDVKSFMAKCGVAYDKSVIRSYLAPLTSNRRRKVLAALKAFYRFTGRPDIVEGFKTPRSKARLVRVPTKEELKRFCGALPDLKHKAIFLMLASSGLRLSELLSLSTKNVNFETRMLAPNCHEGATKHSYITFYNEEAEQVLGLYLRRLEMAKEDLLFPIAKRTLQNIWNKIARKLGVKLTAQTLREWFCGEMLRLGVQEVYVDAF